jgi:hypothetical protein
MQKEGAKKRGKESVWTLGRSYCSMYVNPKGQKPDYIYEYLRGPKTKNRSASEAEKGPLGPTDWGEMSLPPHNLNIYNHERPAVGLKMPPSRTLLLMIYTDHVFLDYPYLRGSVAQTIHSAENGSVGRILLIS